MSAIKQTCQAWDGLFVTAVRWFDLKPFHAERWDKPEEVVALRKSFTSQKEDTEGERDVAVKL